MSEAARQGGSFTMAAAAAAAVRSAWSGPVAPTLAQVLTPSVLADDDLLAETLAADAEERRRRSLPAAPEVYLAHDLSIAQRSGALRVLIMAEVGARAGEPMERVKADLLARLPEHADQVESVIALAAILHEAVDEAEAARAPGARLGKYILKARLGEGAFGEAWQAWDTRLERYVALKILRTAHLAGERGVRRVLAEARAAAALDHESIVRVHAVGQFEETREYYIDSQLVGEPAPTPADPAWVRPGRTLEDRLAEGPLPPLEAGALMAAVSRGVAAAHAQGITHRDIKPANILVTAAGKPKLADFGLSVVARAPHTAPPGESGGPGHEAGGSSASAGSFIAGRVAGTPAYMAPEQARAEPATPLSDVFALGATLRALLTGKPPHQPTTSTDTEAREQVLALARDSALPPLATAAPHLPRTLCAIVDRAMASDPAARYPSADRLAADLEAFLGHRPTLAAPPGWMHGVALWARRNAAVCAIGGVCVLLVAAATVYFVLRLRAERDRALLAEAGAITARDAAVSARDTMSATHQFVARTFNSAHTMERGGATLRDAITIAVARVENTFAGQPLAEASVRHFIGQMAIGAAMNQDARRQLDRALQIRREMLGERHPDTVSCLRYLADLTAIERQHDEAEAMFKQVLALLDEQEGAESFDGLRAIAYLGTRAVSRGEQAEGERLLKRAVAGYERLRLGAPADQQWAMNGLVTLYSGRRDYERAAQVQRAIAEMNRANLGPDDISTLNAQQALGKVLRFAGKAAEAEREFRDVLARYVRTVGLDHVGSRDIAIELGALVLARDPAEARRLAEQSLAGLAAAQPGEPARRPDTLAQRALVLKGRALAALGQREEAEQSLRAAMDGGTSSAGRMSVHAREAGEQLAKWLDEQGRADEAKAVRAKIKTSEEEKR